jgi:hypothetical protein
MKFVAIFFSALILCGCSSKPEQDARAVLEKAQSPQAQQSGADAMKVLAQQQRERAESAAKLGKKDNLSD